MQQDSHPGWAIGLRQLRCRAATSSSVRVHLAGHQMDHPLDQPEDQPAPDGPVKV